MAEANTLGLAGPTLAPDAIQRLRKGSRAAAVSTLLGAVIVLASIGYSTWSLRVAHVQAQLARDEEQRALAAAHSEQRRSYELNARARALEQELADTSKQLAGARESVQYVKNGINLFHAGRYEQAAAQYERALALDPKNGYVENLHGYALFKAHRLDAAVESLRRSVSSEPGYAWGYFDLARVECARRECAAAVEHARRAQELRPELADVMSGDGEFTKLCKTCGM